MSKVFKKISFCLFGLFLLCSMFGKDIVTAKDESIKVNVIFEDLCYTKGDYINIRINIINVDKVNEIKLGISNIDEFNKYISFIENAIINKSSGFTNELVNEVSNETGIRLHLQKEDEVLQESICEINLLCENNISDIISIINKELTIYLFDENNRLLNHQVVFSEKLKATWNILLDELEVYTTVPDYTTSFFVTNRSSDEYEIILEQNIDSSIIGTQVISIIVIDKINNDYLLFNKTIDVVDKTVPILSYPNEVVISDNEVDTLNFSDYINIVDNYDLDASIVYSYYNKEEEQIETFSKFVEYLKSNTTGFIKFYGIDSSSNKTIEVTLKVSVKDTTPPVITKNFDSELVINDTKLNEFDLLECFSISDRYDDNPLLIIEIFDDDGNIINNYKEVLITKMILEVSFYGVDSNNNKTNINNVKLILKDTTIPVISGETEVIIKDIDIFDDFYLEGLKYSDNLDKNPKLEVSFYIEEVATNKYLFLEKLKSGCSGCIEFTVIDNSNNKSETLYKRVKVIDTTSPTIKLLDLKENGKYLKVEEIRYEVSDNFNGTITTYIEVDGVKYEQTLISEIGVHNILIVAEDEAGNITKKEFKINIIENNINGCNGDIDCFVENYTNVIIIVSALTVFSVALVIVKIILEKKKEKNKLKEIKNENIE